MRLESDLVEAPEASIEGRVSDGDFRGRRMRRCVWSWRPVDIRELRSRQKDHRAQRAAKVEGVKVFHAGTRVATGCFTLLADACLASPPAPRNLKTAVDRAYGAVAEIGFEGAHYRKDIAARALKA